MQNFLWPSVLNSMLGESQGLCYTEFFAFLLHSSIYKDF